MLKIEGKTLQELLDFLVKMVYYNTVHFVECSCGGMADALDSGSSGSDTVWVQVPSTAGIIEKAGHKTCLFYYGRGA